MTENAHVAIINESTVLSDAEILPVVSALQHQATYHFAPKWHTSGILKFLDLEDVPQSYWQLIVADDSDQADALGYHETTDAGMPIGFVFAKTDLDYGYSWSVTMSHELLEMLGDPWIELTVFNQTTATKGTMFAYEACDPVEADDLGYTYNGILLSNFVTPNWFTPGSPPPWDYKGDCSQPLQILPGGYIPKFDVSGGSGWKQMAGKGKAPRPHRLSRRERRFKGHGRWRRSERLARLSKKGGE